MKRKPNEIGKILRKMRVDAGETAGVMAGKLGVTASYLSAIELGKRRMTLKLAERIFCAYRLPGKDMAKIRSAYMGNLAINLCGCNDRQIETAISFVKSFRKLDRDTLFKIELLIGQALYWHSRNTGMKFTE